MKKNVWFLFILLAVILLVGCGKIDVDPDFRDYKKEMRLFVQGISSYAKSRDVGFMVIPQNGQEIVTLSGEINGTPALEYLAAIDGVGREDLLYGYEDDNEPTPQEVQNYLKHYLDLACEHGVAVLVTDYCWTPEHVVDSYSSNQARGYISFAADSRELDRIPTEPGQPYGEHTGDVAELADVQNYLYLLNPDQFASKASYLAALAATNYDLLIIDAFFEDEILTQSEVGSLQVKSNGGVRPVIAYMSIGEAESYRYYWQDVWEKNPPTWLAAENPEWEGNYKVRYWDPDWQEVIFGTEDAYLDRILLAGFDGVYLDIIDAFEYFAED